MTSRSYSNWAASAPRAATFRVAGTRLIGLGLILIAVAAGGCSSARTVDVLEARLREREDRLAELDSELQSIRSELTAARREGDSLRKQLADNGQPVLLPEQAAAVFRAEGIQISKLRSGGLDQDGQAGDDQLVAVVFPHDADGELVKLPGTIEIDLFDLSQSDDRRQIGSWRFSTDESLEHWHHGLLGSGFQFQLPWQQVPSSEKVWLHVRLTTPDGRRLEASEQIQIDPPMAGERQLAAPNVGEMDHARFGDADDSGPGLYRQMGYQQSDDAPGSAPSAGLGDRARVISERSAGVEQAEWWNGTREATPR